MADTWTKSGTIWTLTGDTSLAALLAAGLANGDSVMFSGYTLSVDADGINKGIIPLGPGRIDLLAGSRLWYNAAIPSTIAVTAGTAESPLPAYSTAHGYPHNASAVLWSNGNFSIEGRCEFHTAPRGYPAAARAASYPATNKVQFDRDLGLVAGDSISTCMSSGIWTVSAYDAETFTATTTTNINYQSTPKNVGVWWFAAGGGVYVKAVNMTGAVLARGTLALSSSISLAVVSADRVVLFDTKIITSTLGRIEEALLFQDSYLANGNGAGLFVGTIYATSRILVGTNGNGRVSIGGGIGRTACDASGGSAISKVCIEGVEFHAPTVSAPGHGIDVHIRNCRIFNGYGITEDLPEFHIVYGGTATLVSRHALPVDTDLGNMWYFAPNSADFPVWLSETRRLPAGTRLRLNVRCWLNQDENIRVLILPAGIAPIRDTAVKAAAATEICLSIALASWTHSGPTRQEIEDIEESGQLARRWTNGTLEWTNGTDAPLDIEVWTIVSGSTSGAYVRVWESNGGAM